jgi:hypothetical protein
MPPKCTTRSHTTEQAGPSTTEGNPNQSSANTVAQALNKVAKVLQHLAGTTHQEEHRPKAEGEHALERFLKFHPP